MNEMIITLIAISLIILMMMINFKMRKKDENMKREMKSYGSLIKYKDDYICYKACGRGKIILVIMSGYGEPSPYLDFKPLIQKLVDKYTIYVIEPCGYGCSTFTKRNRSTDEIISEIDAVIEKRRIKEFTFLCHSFSGIYALAYMNKYPYKVKAFIGIDCSVPRQINDKKSWCLNMAYVYFGKVLKCFGIYQYFCLHFEEFILPQISGYTWSNSDQEYKRRLSIINTANPNTIKEMWNLLRNLKSVQNLTYTVPSLQFISKESEKGLKNWKAMHLCVLNKKFDNVIIELDGPHYLHHKFIDEIKENIEKFLSDIYLE